MDRKEKVRIAFVIMALIISCISPVLINYSQGNNKPNDFLACWFLFSAIAFAIFFVWWSNESQIPGRKSIYCFIGPGYIIFCFSWIKNPSFAFSFVSEAVLPTNWDTDMLIWFVSFIIILVGELVLNDVFDKKH